MFALVAHQEFCRQEDKELLHMVDESFATFRHESSEANEERSGNLERQVRDLTRRVQRLEEELRRARATNVTGSSSSGASESASHRWAPY